LGNQFGRATQLAGQGLGATEQQANLRGQQAGLSGSIIGQLAGQQAGLFGRGADIAANRGALASSLLGGGGNLASEIFTRAGRDLAQGRLQTGRDLASQIGGTASGLSALAQQQGTGLQNILSTGATNLANILSGAGQGISAGQQNLAQLLANLNVGEGSQLSALQQQLGLARSAGELATAQGVRNTLSQAAGLGALFLSDVRLKKNIKKIGSLKGVDFFEWEWNGLLGLKGKSQGVIAQLVEKAIPGSVIDAEYKIVDYRKIAEAVL
jgi:hypothetical protein